MAGVIDFHTHAFPDRVAATAIPALEKEGNIRSHLDGTVAGLLASMDHAGIDRSVVCSIATRPEQFAPIFRWSQDIRSPRIVPLPSIQPGRPRSAPSPRSHSRGRVQGYQNALLLPGLPAQRPAP